MKIPGTLSILATQIKQISATMDWITEQIAIGNFVDAKQVSQSDVDAILCLKEACCDEDNDDLIVLCMPLIDGPGNDMRAIRDAVDFIRDAVRSGDRILVHCHAGRSRSVCVVAKYLMVESGMTRRQALQFIEAKRAIYLSDGIEDILTRAL